MICIKYDDTMELRHLRYFVAVAEELHFGRAAERLRISQPPLSQQIAALESELGVKLFERGRRTALTHAGRIMLPEARATLEQADRAITRARRAERGEIGNLSIGFVASATYLVLPVLLKSFRRRCPEVELSLSSLTTEDQLSALGKGSIDVGFSRALSSDAFTDGISMRSLLREPLVAVLPEGHPAAENEKVRLGNLSEERFLLWPRRSGPVIFDQIIAMCGKAGFHPNVVQESVNALTIAGLVAAGVGVSLQIGDPRLMKSHGVVYRAVDDPGAFWELVVAYRDQEYSPVVEIFLDVVEENIALMAIPES
jgi:DNA-binding transcriptional LysR family regulator